MNNNRMEAVAKLFLFTRADSVGSIAIRGLIWLTIVLLLAYGLDSGKSYKKIKADAGWFFLFIFSIGLVSYMLFGFTITF
jgi:hypothetical protein